MATQRYYYSDSISDFLSREPEFVIGKMVTASPKDVDVETKNSWLSEIAVMKKVLPKYSGRGSVFFEYNIPRMGRCVDVVLLLDGIIFILEFKTGAEQKNYRAAMIQAWDYALDLKNFQEGSLDRLLVPIATFLKVPSKSQQTQLIPYEDGVYYPLLVKYLDLTDCISKCLQVINNRPDKYIAPEDADWANSGYSPTPTIIEAATALYSHHTVEDITKHGGDIDTTINRLSEIVDQCEKEHRKAICFVTGVPGAGKTLVGLQTAINEFKNGKKAVYLSGNFPLVEVLQEALARDYVTRSKEDYKHGLVDKKATKADAKTKVKAFIQMIHHYRDEYLIGTEIKGGEVVPIMNFDYSKTKSHFDKTLPASYIPKDTVAIFDEAQRSWKQDALKKFMKDKKGIDNFPYSEPEFLISCMDRRQDWGVIVCLIGGGQEINKGEAGLKEWIDAIYRRFKNWDVFISDKLTEREYMDDDAREQLSTLSNVHPEPELHLSVSMRSFKAEKVSTFVHQVLDLNPEEAAKTLQEFDDYPIVLTRSLDVAKQWLRSHTRGSERCGLLASAKAERLKAISVNVRYQPNFVNWFLEDDTDIRSSNRLEDTLTEFKVQGLEIDWAGVIWDADMRLEKDGKWHHYYLHGGARWNNIKLSINQDYQLNAYRVLLTRARQGMVIVVPEGDPTDDTRKPELYDRTYEYLRSIGIKSLDTV